MLTSRRQSLSTRLALLAVLLAVTTTLTFLPTTALAASTVGTWVENFVPTQLWSGPSGAAADYGAIPQWSYLQIVAPQQGTRLFVYVPWTKNYAYVDAKSVGPSGPPPPGWSVTVPSTSSDKTLLSSTTSADWVGRVIGAQLLERAAPSVSAPVVKTLPGGTEIQVVAWVSGTEVIPGNWTWAQLADGHFAYSAVMQIVPPKTPPPPPTNHPTGKWVDVNLLHQTAVAYESNQPVYLAIVSSGSPGWETPVGVHAIERRVANETMRSSTLSSLGLDAQKLAQAHYDLQNVLYTQYFDGFGDALHDNYWLTAQSFGIPHSHGCVGMQVNDALWFWNWANIGVPVVVHAN